MHGILCDAIRAKRLVRFIYDGYERIVEPHLHGINAASHEILTGWLVGGWSESRPEPGWRNYLVKDMHDVHALADHFEGPRPKYNAFDPKVRQVFCRLEPVVTRPRTVDGPLVADAPPAPESSGLPTRPADDGLGAPDRSA